MSILKKSKIWTKLICLFIFASISLQSNSGYSQQDRQRLDSLFSKFQSITDSKGSSKVVKINKIIEDDNMLKLRYILKGNNYEKWETGDISIYEYCIKKGLNRFAQVFLLQSKKLDNEVSFKAKAESGNSKAKDNLGTLYYFGEGVPQDDSKAFEWWYKAVLAGSKEAQIHLGSAYANGWGIQNDNPKAFEWIQKAANKGDASAQYSIGMRYFEGDGVGVNKQLALEWIQKAKDNGSPFAERDFEKIKMEVAK